MKPENRSTEGETDLFGNPLLPLRDRRGRPSFKKTPENQQFVALRAAAGWTQERIAADMGTDPKTLRKYFSRELENGALMIEGQHLDVLSQQARKGSVSAIKALDEICARGQRRRTARDFEKDNDDASKETVPLGKKEQARRAAQQSFDDDSGDWSGDLKPGVYN